MAIVTRTPRGAIPRPPHPIFTAGPSITAKEIAYVTDAISNGLNEHSFDYITKLEEAFKVYVDVTHTLATSSCTGALHLALWGLNVGEGDEVIVPDMTWVASAAPIHYQRAKPVFVDIERGTWCIDPHAVERAITKKTKAIIAVHTYGYPAAMDAINAIAEQHGIAVIEDAAPSLGSAIGSRRTGGLGRIGAFSFHGSKIAAAGEGGMICTGDETLMKRIRVLGNHGRDGGRMLTATCWGIKYNMSNLQAAFALSQLERIDELFAKKRQNYAWYRELLGDIEGISISTEQPGITWNAWQTSVILERDFGITRDEVMGKLKEVGIDTRPFFPPVSSLPMVNVDLSRENPISYWVAERGINLPSRHDLTEDNAAYVAQELRRILKI
jgi:perosamine synthetase